MKVCVIGAGSSGLTTIKKLLDEGHDVTCFEKTMILVAFGIVKMMIRVR